MMTQITGVWEELLSRPEFRGRQVTITILDQPTAAPEADVRVQSLKQGEWSESLNARRCDLIDKDIEGTLSAEERLELEDLQRLALAYRDRVAPPPIEGALRLHRELLEKKRQAADER